MRWRGLMFGFIGGMSAIFACSSFDSETGPENDADAGSDAVTTEAAPPDGGPSADADAAPATCPIVAATTGDGALPATEVACGTGSFDLNTNPQHCGSCDRVCGQGQDCLEGSCVGDVVQPLPTGSKMFFGDGDTIWIARHESPTKDIDSILKVSLVGAASEVFSAPDAGGIVAFARGPTYSFASVGGLGLVAIANDGGPPLAALTPSFDVPWYTFTLGESLFYTDGPEIRKTSIDGGFTTFFTVGPDIDRIARDARFVLATRTDAGAGSDAGELLRFELDGGEIRRFPVGPRVVMTSDASYTYFYDMTVQGVFRLSNDAPPGSPAERIASWTADTGAWADDIILDGEDLFVLVRSNLYSSKGHILRVPRCGGPIVPVVRTTGLTKSLGGFQHIHVRGSWLYYVESTSSGASLVKVPR